jgi:hypothetical protein
MLTLTNQINQLTAIDAVHAASRTSEKYGFVSTRSVIDNLTNLGFTTRSVQIQRVNKEERKGFQKHIVRMQHSSLMPKVGDEFPEIVLINSHDGGCSYRMLLGMFRLVCTNGMVSGNIEDEIRFVHRKVNIERINEGVMQMVGRAARLGDVVSRMKSRELTQPEHGSFVEEAVKLRYDRPGQDADYADQREWDNRLRAMNSLRRAEDRGNDLWHIFNRVQENLTQGRARSGVRRITSPTTDLNVNRELWNLAEQFLN